MKTFQSDQLDYMGRCKTHKKFNSIRWLWEFQNKSWLCLSYSLNSVSICQANFHIKYIINVSTKLFFRRYNFTKKTDNHRQKFPTISETRLERSVVTLRLRQKFCLKIYKKKQKIVKIRTFVKNFFSKIMRKNNFDDCK